MEGLVLCLCFCFFGLGDGVMFSGCRCLYPCLFRLLVGFFRLRVDGVGDVVVLGLGGFGLLVGSWRLSVLLCCWLSVVIGVSWFSRLVVGRVEGCMLGCRSAMWVI